MSIFRRGARPLGCWSVIRSWFYEARYSSDFVCLLYTSQPQPEPWMAAVSAEKFVWKAS
jgi:hypothetical protein